MKCIIDDCHNTAVCKGWCDKHYRRWLHHGDPNIVKPSGKRFTHRMSAHPLYGIWLAMMHRCYQKSAISYPRYGGRGITVCARWRRVENFISDMHPRPSPDHSLDRIDNDGPYELQNCRWATNAEQSRNTCMSRLTAAIVKNIRDRVSAGERQAVLAREYRVDATTIRDVIHGRTWR